MKVEELAPIFFSLFYAKPVQMYGRLIFMLKRLFLRITASKSLSERAKELLARLAPVSELRFNLLNREAHYEWGDFTWEDRRQEKLWRYTLNYFYWIRERPFEEAAALVLHWIAHNDDEGREPWEPAVISHRISQWIDWAEKHRDDTDAVPGFQELLEDSLMAQLLRLSLDLEFHVQANHLLENYKALFTASLYLYRRCGCCGRCGKETGRHLTASIDGFLSQMDEQILPDGGHYERSPMYHCLAMLAVREVMVGAELAGSAELKVGAGLAGAAEAGAAQAGSAELQVGAGLAGAAEAGAEVAGAAQSGSAQACVQAGLAQAGVVQAGLAQSMEMRSCEAEASTAIEAGERTGDDRKFPELTEGKLTELFKRCTTLISKMEEWRCFMTHPDGAMALFGDSALSAYPIISEKPSGQVNEAVHHLTDSGYEIRRWGDGNYFVMKLCGPAPAWQPGHSHCDTLSFELSLIGERVVVDSGCGSYQNPAIRRYCRGTAAHNVAWINGHEQSEWGGAFRFGRRAIVRSCVVTVEGDSVAITALLEDYKGNRISRKLALTNENLSVEDRLVKRRVKGSFVSLIHLAPSVEITEKDNHTVHLSGKNVRFSVAARSSLAVKPSKYYPEFGLEMENHCIEVSAGDDSVIEYTIAFQESR